MMNKAYINHIEYLFSGDKISNEDLCQKFPGNTPEDIFKKTGIKNRYKSRTGELVSDQAAACGEYFFAQYTKINKQDIDFLVFCTECPDYTAPATSCIIQHKLGLNKNIGTLDLAFGCSGYTYGIAICKSLVESGMASKVLFITSDMPTSVLSPDDPELHFLFSDAASASLISNTPNGFLIGKCTFGTDGNGADSLKVDQSAYQNIKTKNWYEHTATKTLAVGRMYMDGPDLLSFSLREIPPLVYKLLSDADMNADQISQFVFHQASKFVLKSLQRKLKIPDHQFVYDIESHGNTVSASIPIVLKNLWKLNNFTHNQKILVAGFGIGFSWSGTILTYTEK